MNMIPEIYENSERINGQFDWKVRLTQKSRVQNNNHMI